MRRTLLTAYEIERASTLFFDRGWDTLRIAQYFTVPESNVYNALHRHKEQLLAEMEEA